MTGYLMQETKLEEALLSYLDESLLEIPASTVFSSAQL